MKTEDENIGKEKNRKEKEKSSETMKEKYTEDDASTIRKVPAPKTSPEGHCSVGQSKTVVTDTLVKNDQCKHNEHTMKNEVRKIYQSENESASQETVKTTKKINGNNPAQGYNSQKSDPSNENSVVHEKSDKNTQSKMCNPRSDPKLKSAQDPQNNTESTLTNGSKISQPCPDSDMKSRQEFRNKIHSARANGKSINAWLYEMDNGINNKDKGASNEDSATDQLSLKLKDLSVADKTSLTETKPNATEAADLTEDTNFQSKGPMIGYPKHPNHYQPYQRPTYFQTPPQQVPDFRAVEDLDFQFYDEDSLLKALDSIAPETSPHTSPEHCPAERLACENCSTDDLTLPNPHSSGMNNQFYINPTQLIGDPPKQQVPTLQHLSGGPNYPPKQQVPTLQHLSGGPNYDYCANTQQRSTSADTVMNKQSLPVSNDPRPNSYPSTQSESIDDLFNIASDIIDNDLRKTNQPILPTPQHQGSNPQYSPHTVTNAPVPRCHPSLGCGFKENDIQGTQNITRVMAARPPQLPGPHSQIPPTNREVTVKKREPHKTAGNLPNILFDVPDNTIQRKTQASKTSASPQNTKVINGNFMKESQVVKFPVATQIMAAPAGTLTQNPVVLQGPSLVPFSEGVSSVMAPTVLSNPGEQNPLQRNELISSKSSQPVNVRPMHPSTGRVEGKHSMPQTMIQNVPLQQGLPIGQTPMSNTYVNPMNYTTSQPVCDPQKIAQPTIYTYPLHPNSNACPVPINPTQTGVNRPDSSVTQLIGRVPSNGLYGGQPLNVILYPTPTDKPKPRYRKILPKPSPPVEGGK